MKRLHVHLAVNDVTESVAFYTALFQSEPTVLKPDYAKWQLDDPRISLKQMMPVVQALEAEGSGLANMQEQGLLPTDLSRIASEVAVTAQVEISKFHRGDYV